MRQIGPGTVRMITMVALGLMAVGAAIWTISEALDSRSEIFEKDGVAMRGYDPVAYLQEQRDMKGSANYRTQYQGAIFQFTSAANRDAYAADPQRFVPQYGGHCAFGVAGELCSAGHQLSSGQAIPRFGVISRCPRNLPSLEEWLRL